MYEIIKDSEEIGKAQAKFEYILKYKIIPLKRKLSHPRTKEDFEEKKDNLFDIYWSQQFEFWSAFDHNKPRNKNRYWNCFGLKNPLNNECLTITIEICIPKKGEIKNIAGLFIIDNKTKDIAIVSRGKLSRKKMKVFWDNYKGETINLIDGTKVALIGILPVNENKIEDFHKKVKDFLLEVKRIKSIGIEDSVDLFEEKQVLKPIWLDCLRELFEEAEKRNDKEITISVLDLQHYAQNKNIKNVKLTNRSRSIFNAMRSREVLEEDDIIINNTDSSTTFTIKYKLPRKRIIEKQNLETIEKETIVINKPNSILIKHSNPTYEIIFKQVNKLIYQINEHGKKGKKKLPIFKESGMQGLLLDIEKYCTSKESFKSFILSLYILFREKTRDVNINKKDKNDHHYIYRFPEKFWDKDRITKNCMDNVIVLRSEYSHSDDDEYLAQKQRKSFIDVVEELTRRHIPETTIDFQELQLKIMNQFKDAMEELLSMLKDDL